MLLCIELINVVSTCRILSAERCFPSTYLPLYLSLATIIFIPGTIKWIRRCCSCCSCCKAAERYFSIDECLKRKNVPVELMWDKRLRQVSVGRLFEVDIVIVDVFGNVLFQDNQIHKQSFIKSVVQFEMFKIDTWLTLSLCLWQLNEISWRIVYIELYGMISVSKMFVVFVSKANIV